ncbi:short-chain dehydrogenase [Desulfosarcina ovata subsp. sediminis]|uniref:Short-chain dehydrogenase n=1 Tax=Desulfosarcina ovata subsp. sediminis TaxID=885957 RepID=A0A5K7ZGG5_9BACT|nr:SDR family oxidoreductase [Desulfosarcina ovata]BBO81288.1 short-chain dehydrogenase [Desulfosarcina ovata subsp. sediminis]
MSETTIILGATSGIARALAQELGSCGDNLVLAARDEEQLKATAKDLQIRHSIQVGTVHFDAMDFDSHAKFWRQMQNTEAGTPTRIVLCYGYMASQEECQNNFAKAKRTFDINLTSACSLLELAAAYFSNRGNGTIAIISSVAGDRGRATNYIYGASKAGLTAYASGLRNRLCKQGVHVLTIKPGMVDTPMTKGLINSDSPLVATAEKIAIDIRKALDRKKNVIYTQWFWRYIMMIIRSIPESVFKLMKI